MSRGWRRALRALSIAACGALASGGATFADLAAQCGPTVGLGVGFPLADPPPGSSPGGWNLTGGPGVSAGLACRRADALRLGGEFRVQSFEKGFFLYLLGSLGAEWTLAEGDTSPWIRLGALAGPTYGSRMGLHSLLLVSGPNAKDPSIGFAVGPGVRFGVPGSRHGAFYVDVALLATFLDTWFAEAGGRSGSAGWSAFTYIPVTMGYQFPP